MSQRFQHLTTPHFSGGFPGKASGTELVATVSQCEFPALQPGTPRLSAWIGHKSAVVGFSHSTDLPTSIKSRNSGSESLLSPKWCPPPAPLVSLYKPKTGNCPFATPPGPKRNHPHFLPIGGVIQSFVSQRISPLYRAPPASEFGLLKR